MGDPFNIGFDVEDEEVEDLEKTLLKNPETVDSDKDDVRDLLDCRPLNPKKQDQNKNWFSGKDLGSVGYDVDDPTSKRRNALKKMIRSLANRGMTKAEAAMKTWQKLHGLYVTWSNQPGYQESDVTAVRRDRDWVSKNYEMNR
ncbi:MAG: hypothetical protein ABEJ72_07920 [Candidatus Aenigmatarchaeota archaeon]